MRDPGFERVLTAILVFAVALGFVLLGIDWISGKF